jgi:membrane fusion protein (multidrug efflux system)
LAWEIKPKKYERSAPVMLSSGMKIPQGLARWRPLCRWLAGGLVLVAGALLGFHRWQDSRCWVSTDNAYLEGPVHPIAARLVGTVAEVLVEENSRVAAGQVLVRLDPRDAQARREQSAADLAEASAGLSAARANVTHAEANARLAEVALAKARLDLSRLQGLNHAVAQQEVDHAQAAFDTATAALGAARSQVESARAEVTVAQAKETAAAAGLQAAELQCEYTTITAPVAGRVGRRNVETGQPVIPSQPLLALVSDELWLVANFKETQIRAIRPGQPALIRFDALPGREWAGTVESLSPASGSRFALLPPDNATGNFTRVVQRLPIRIRLGDAERAELGPLLVPGLSATVRVRIRPPVPTAAEPPPGSLTRR